MTRRILDVSTADDIGALDAGRRRARARRGVAATRATPRKSTRRCCGWATSPTARPRPGSEWLDAARRRRPRGARERSLVRRRRRPREPKTVLRGRLEALGPVLVDAADRPTRSRSLRELEADGAVLRTRIDGQRAVVRPAAAVAHPPLHARPAAARDRAGHRGAVPALPRLLAARGPAASRWTARAAWRRSCAQLAGFEAPAAAWEASILPARVRGYKRGVARPADAGRRGRVGAALGRRRSRRSAGRRSRSSRAPSSSLDGAGGGDAAARSRRRTAARGARRAARARRDVRPGDRAGSRTCPLASVEEGLGALVAAGRVTCDSFGGLRWLLVPAWRRRSRRRCPAGAGAWSRPTSARATAPAAASPHAEFVARALLRRTGVVFRRTTTRERIPVPWRDVARACRTLEARGEIRGGRFVGGLRRRAVRAAGSGRRCSARCAGRAPAAGLDAAQRGRGRPAQLPGHPHPGRAGARVRRLRGRGRLRRRSAV